MIEELERLSEGRDRFAALGDVPSAIALEPPGCGR